MIALGFGDMQKMMRQVQKMQSEMLRIQEETGQRTVEASAGGGAVVATANGKGELTEIRIRPEAIDPSDPAMLGDMVLAACNEALRQARELMTAAMARATGLPPGGLPGMPGLPGR